jgi:transcriptional regulator with XRE-family HTH domain
MSESAAAFGRLLSRWRRVRGKSQLGLAVDAAVSPRHVSFVETGRSKPSREMVLTLATALDVPPCASATRCSWPRATPPSTARRAWTRPSSSPRCAPST